MKCNSRLLQVMFTRRHVFSGVSVKMCVEEYLQHLRLHSVSIGSLLHLYGGSDSAEIFFQCLCGRSSILALRPLVLVACEGGLSVEEVALPRGCLQLWGSRMENMCFFPRSWFVFSLCLAKRFVNLPFQKVSCRTNRNKSDTPIVAIKNCKRYKSHKQMFALAYFSNCKDHFDQKDSEDVTGQCYIQPELAALDAAYTAWEVAKK